MYKSQRPAWTALSYIQSANTRPLRDNIFGKSDAALLP